jgi:hypothetical protein
MLLQPDKMPVFKVLLLAMAFRGAVLAQLIPTLLAVLALPLALMAVAAVQV